MTTIARIFPRKTPTSPTDDLAFFGPPSNEVEADPALTRTVMKAKRHHV